MPSDVLPASGSPPAAAPPPPRPADAQRRAAGQRLAAVRGALDRALLGLLAVLDDVAALEQDPLGDLAPQRRAPQQELEIHGEVLELLALRVAHHRDGVPILLDRDALLVP